MHESPCKFSTPAWPIRRCPFIHKSFEARRSAVCLFIYASPVRHAESFIHGDLRERVGHRAKAKSTNDDATNKQKKNSEPTVHIHANMYMEKRRVRTRFIHVRYIIARYILDE